MQLCFTAALVVGTHQIFHLFANSNFYFLVVSALWVPSLFLLHNLFLGLIQLFFWLVTQNNSHFLFCSWIIYPFLEICLLYCKFRCFLHTHALTHCLGLSLGFEHCLLAFNFTLRTIAVFWIVDALSLWLFWSLSWFSLFNCCFCFAVVSLALFFPAYSSDQKQFLFACVSWWKLMVTFYCFDGYHFHQLFKLSCFLMSYKENHAFVSLKKRFDLVYYSYSFTVWWIYR